MLSASAAAAQDAALQVTAGLSGMVDNYLTEIASQHWQARARTMARITTPAQVKERQTYIRKKVLDAIGGFPERTPLNARITGTLEGDGYRIEKLIYESQPRFYVTANLYVPTGGKGSIPGDSGHCGPQHKRKSPGALSERVDIARQKGLRRARLRPVRPGRTL